MAVSKDSVGAASLGEMQLHVPGQEPRPGQAVVICWAHRVDLPDGGDPTEDVEQLGI